MVHHNELTKVTRRNFIKLLGGSVGFLAAGSVLGTLAGCAGVYSSYENSKMFNELEKVYPLAREITHTSSSVEDAVKAVVQWSEKNFFHYYEEPGENYGMNVVYGARDLDDYFNNVIPNLSIEDVFRERAVGCHLATFVMATMLRSIGISAEYIKESEGRMGVWMGGHGVLYIPEIERYVHGDLVADLVSTPANKIIQSESELRAMSSRDGSYISFHDEIFDKYWLRLHRLGNNLYVFGEFGNASEEETNEVLSNLSEYNLRLQSESHGQRWVDSDHIPIRRLD